MKVKSQVQAIRTPTKEDDTQWLMYWTVFATFSIVDSMASIITYYLSSYWLLKVDLPIHFNLENSDRK